MHLKDSEEKRADSKAKRKLRLKSTSNNGNEFISRIALNIEEANERISRYVDKQ